MAQKLLQLLHRFRYEDALFESEIDNSTVGCLLSLGSGVRKSTELIRFRIRFKLKRQSLLGLLSILKVPGILFNRRQQCHHDLNRYVSASNDNPSELADFDANLLYVPKLTLMCEHNIKVLSDSILGYLQFVSLFRGAL